MLRCWDGEAGGPAAVGPGLLAAEVAEEAAHFTYLPKLSTLNSLEGKANRIPYQGLPSLSCGHGGEEPLRP